MSHAVDAWNDWPHTETAVMSRTCDATAVGASTLSCTSLLMMSGNTDICLDDKVERRRD